MATTHDDHIRQLTARVAKLERAVRQLQAATHVSARHGDSPSSKRADARSLASEAQAHEIKWAGIRRVAAPPQVWKDALLIIRGRVEPHIFDAWFLGSTIADDTGEFLTISTDSELRSRWLARKYAKLVQSALAEAGRPGVKLTFESRY